MRYLIALTLTLKVAAYAAITIGAALIYLPAAWIVGGCLGWWLVKEEIEPWVTMTLRELSDGVPN